MHVDLNALTFIIFWTEKLLQLKRSKEWGNSSFKFKRNNEIVNDLELMNIFNE